MKTNFRMRTIFIFFALLVSLHAFVQKSIKVVTEKVLDEEPKPLVGVNIISANQSKFYGLTDNGGRFNDSMSLKLESSQSFVLRSIDRISIIDHFVSPNVKVDSAVSLYFNINSKENKIEKCQYFVLNKIYYTITNEDGVFNIELKSLPFPFKVNKKYGYFFSESSEFSFLESFLGTLYSFSYNKINLIFNGDYVYNNVFPNFDPDWNNSTFRYNTFLGFDALHDHKFLYFFYLPYGCSDHNLIGLLPYHYEIQRTLGIEDFIRTFFVLRTTEPVIVGVDWEILGLQIKDGVVEMKATAKNNANNKEVVLKALANSIVKNFNLDLKRIDLNLNGDKVIAIVNN